MPNPVEQVSESSRKRVKRVIRDLRSRFCAAAFHAAARTGRPQLAVSGGSRPFWVMAGLCLCAALARAPFLFTVGVDKSFYLVVARQWLEGTPPYAGAFDVKPPLLFALVASAETIFGPALVAAKALATAAVAATACGLYLFGRRFLVQPAGSSHTHCCKRSSELPAVSCTKVDKLLVRLIRGKSFPRQQQRGQDFPRGELGELAGAAAGLFYIASTVTPGGVFSPAELLMAPFTTFGMLAGFSAARAARPRASSLLCAGFLFGAAACVKQTALFEALPLAAWLFFDRTLASTADPKLDWIHRIASTPDPKDVLSATAANGSGPKEKLAILGCEATHMRPASFPASWPRGRCQTKRTPPICPTHRHPGQAKREPGYEKMWAFQCAKTPDKASPFRDDKTKAIRWRTWETLLSGLRAIGLFAAGFCVIPAAFALYFTARGHLDALVADTIVSAAARAGASYVSWGEAIARLFIDAALALPLAVMATAVFVFRGTFREHKAYRAIAFLAAWAAAALAAVLAARAMFVIYFLPLLQPLSLAAGLCFARGVARLAPKMRRAFALPAAFAAIALYSAAPSLPLIFAGRDNLASATAAAAAMRAAGLSKEDRILVADRDLIVYLASGANPPGPVFHPLQFLCRFAVPGADSVLKNALNSRPAFIVAAEPTYTRPCEEPDRRPMLQAALARDYCPIGRFASTLTSEVGGAFVVYGLRDRAASRCG